ncbi:MAG TPA: hypothetical protein DEO65_16670 [Bacillus bacterium]|uniref:Glycosyltransferase subfamily 4-like N-terminal domain-containing protein n=1 Tax=Siminovitchia fordii TaxID=254759 RepID=A0ABQ4K1I1_9BACI|nr:glycosyltransferase [Siminovitchia fordii]GIN19621.1 hypothetical protein J1TS3_07550 [Siminovitchia fordii]HBZ11471.1 hypothetical protein [Bacillus sp. (in: firmicutes)]
MKLNILQLYDYMELGGAESHIITLSKALMDRGHSVYIASSFGPAVKILNRLSIPFYEINAPKDQVLFENAGKILEIIDHHNIDIIHVHPFQSQEVAALIKLLRDIPVVTTIHGAYLTPSVKGLEEFIDSYIFISPESRDFHMANKLIPNKQFNVVPNCVEIGAADISVLENDGTLRIAYISRLDDDKLPSLDFFIECVEQLSSRVDVQIGIIGSGSQYSYIVKRVEQINDKLSKKMIHAVNGSDNINKIIKNYEVVVGVGRVILEALALGKIPICIGNNNYVGIVKEQILRRISKVNFTDRNTDTPQLPELFIEDIMKIIKKPRLIKNDILQAFHFIKDHYDVKLSAYKHERLYAEVMANRRRRSLTINDLINNVPAEIDNMRFALELREKGIKYELDALHNKKVLLKPDFNNAEDNWIQTLTSLAKEYENHKTTIVIRIGNEFMGSLESVIKEIEDVYNLLIESFDLDILVDYQYHDEVSENLFLFEMDCFYTTNNSQYRLIYKCELLGCRILTRNQTF